MSLQFCTEHGNDTVRLCAKFQNDWIFTMDFMDERNIIRFKFKLSFKSIFYRPHWGTEIILVTGSTNESWCYNVMSSLIGWAHIQNDPNGSFSAQKAINAEISLKGFPQCVLLSNPSSQFVLVLWAGPQTTIVLTKRRVAPGDSISST